GLGAVYRFLSLSNSRTPRLRASPSIPQPWNVSRSGPGSAFDFRVSVGRDTAPIKVVVVNKRWKLGVNRPTTYAITTSSTSKRNARPIRVFPLGLVLRRSSDQRRGSGTFQAPLDGLAAPFRGSRPF